MEEELKRIECLIERCNQCKLNACITCDICWSEVQAIENLLTRYKDLVETSIRLSKECVELEEENKKLNANLVYRKLQLTECIPISVIQNKLDELLEKENSVEDGIKGLGQILDCRTQVQVLQELLEESTKTVQND